MENRKAHGFERVSFHGEFRDYQSRVLNNAEKYLDDGKLNIVAAPGSGKTVLGLELIRRLGEPCLIFSPTTAIREQWGERFRELFLEDESEFDELFSTNLRDIKLVNSVTYQALFSSMSRKDAHNRGSEASGGVTANRGAEASGGATANRGSEVEGIAPQSNSAEDSYFDVDIISEIKKHHIGTICLDEAHHLKNEWQKALEKLLEQVGKEVKVIALTATPPYDSDSSEWRRYLEMCGEVDEEIFVPELVARDTLCPHQDYIYFNHPTLAEATVLKTYRDNVKQALEEIGNMEFWPNLVEQLNRETDYDKLFTSAPEYIALMILMQHYGLELDENQFHTMVGKHGLPAFKLDFAEKAYIFLVEGDLLDEDQKESLVAILKKHSLYFRRKVQLAMNDKLKRSLISSVGKLESISTIAKSEYEVLGSDLRMLVLTDYIKKENLAKITSTKNFSEISIVSIFETLRRAADEMSGGDAVGAHRGEATNARANTDSSHVHQGALNIGVLSGTLVILPNAVLQDETLAELRFTTSEIAGTEYSIINAADSPHVVVKAVSDLFEKGGLQILIGTKSLLGEGWDAPCINSLIMASFVGSYVLSNQMRGRAIRIDKNNPDKTANIWHLVTVEPESIFEKDKLTSYDFEVLKRRFDSFMGPHYENGTIESGIERISIVEPPYGKSGVARINAEMLELSRDRGAMRDKWNGQVKGGKGKVRVALENEVEKEKGVPVFNYTNVAGMSLMTAAWAAYGTMAATVGMQNLGVLKYVMFAVMTPLILFGSYRVGKRVARNYSPARSIRTLGIAVYSTLVECGYISNDASVVTCLDGDSTHVGVALRDASAREQNTFTKALAEMVSPIENPRYVLVGKDIFRGYNYKMSFACPSIIGKKKEHVQILARNLDGSVGHFEPMYTRNEHGRELILHCRKESYISETGNLLQAKYRVKRWE